MNRRDFMTWLGGLIPAAWGASRLLEDVATEIDEAGCATIGKGCSLAGPAIHYPGDSIVLRTVEPGRIVYIPRTRTWMIAIPEQAEAP